jgi:hypothetical protein
MYLKFSSWDAARSLVHGVAALFEGVKVVLEDILVERKDLFKLFCFQAEGVEPAKRNNVGLHPKSKAANIFCQIKRIYISLG